VKNKGKQMKSKIAIVQVVLGLSISVAALAQNSGSQAVPSPIGAHEVANTPSAMETPATLPGGLYRLANGFLSCPDTLYLMRASQTCACALTSRICTEEGQGGGA
jgi:hypothetical protein